MRHFAAHQRANAAFAGLTGGAALSILLVLAVILGDVAINGLPRLSWEFISASPRDGMMAGGIFPAIFGTVLLVLLMIVAVIPVGVLTAVYLFEYARQESFFARAVRSAVYNLSGVPSIVFGLFGVGFFIQFLGGNIDRLFLDGRMMWGQPAILWSALTLAVLTLPVVIVSTEEALRTVPREHREAALALGSTKFEAVFRIVLPQAMPGILTGAILAVARGAGETAPILFTGAAYFLPHLPTHAHDQFMHLGYHVYVLATQSPDIEATRPLLYGTVLVLLLVTVVLNLVAITLRNRLRAGRA
ncbi:phosphate ABC transporter permease PstA [Vulgatibacter incomptus]|uniref:Phosphate transport system permease protein PstA n=1 Tax=Vulgatibacter incomptus TaxID=1391653 RepID=A0A0K1PEY5_9BACT|nr:phosphate ABC transporter permease PstA [Vulgatibacter incomptus]AKU92080.1 Phosphate transport system permease protein PstA [Vulgatibacter incomptus]